MSFELCDFAKRQLDPQYPGTRVTEEIVEQLIELCKKAKTEIPGYADFCKIIPIRNIEEDGTVLFPSLKVLTVEKDWALENGAIQKTAYEARTEEELAVLVEWVEGIEAPTAPWIHIIVYSREQLAEENDLVKADWGIVSIQTASTADVEPMRPITAMRNALGVEEGGSGSAIDRQSYKESSDFWSKHIMIREA